MHLRCILEFVGRPLDQEQAWAILYQCSCLLKRIWRQRQRDAQPIFPVELDFICLASDGSIDIQWQGNKENGLVAATRRRDVLASLGWAVYRGLDYSLAEDEARELQEDLEKVITRMTDNSGEDERDVDFDTVIEACRVRLPLLEQTDSHYKSVCRSLVTSAKKQSYKQNHDVQVAETYELQGKISAYDTLPDVVPNEWMVHWMHVVDQLKQGVELQKIILPEKPSNRKYELTPYEKLMESIKHPPQLNSALELAEISEEVQLQRSHPHLKPVSSRKLSSKPADVLTPMERLILEIQSPSTLKKTCTRIQSEPICAGMLHDHGCSMFTRRTSASPAPERSPMTVKRKLKARTLSEMFSDAEKESETSETVSSSRLTRTLTIEKIVSFDGEPVVRQQPAIDQENPGSSLQGDTEHLTSFHQTSILSVPTKSEGGDGGSEALGLASSVGQMHKTGEVSSKPAISLDELRHIREVLDRALLESLETEENALYLSLKMGKVCNSCHDTRFSFFDRNRTCDVCIKRVCSKCLSKVSMPAHYVDEKFVQQHKSKPVQRSQSFHLARRPSLRRSFRKKFIRPVIDHRKIDNPVAVYDDEVDTLGGPKTVEVNICALCRKLLGGVDGGGQKGLGNKLMNSQRLPLTTELVSSDKQIGHLPAMQCDGRTSGRTKRSLSRLSQTQDRFYSEEVFV